MFSTVATLILAAGVTAQHPTPSAAPPALSAEEVVRLESRHLTNTRQVTSGFSRAGEGYFSPNGHSIIFQAVVYLAPSIFHHPKPDEDGYQIFTGSLVEDTPATMVSTGKGRCTCPYFHPNGKSILFASTHLSPSTEAAPTKGPAYSRTERYRWEFPETMDIFTADPDGKNLKRLTDAPGYDAEGSYSSDGKRIVFTSFRDGDAEIYIMDADGTSPRRITQKVTMAAHFSLPMASESFIGAIARATTCCRSM
jgi:TolB protein